MVVEAVVSMAVSVKLIQMTPSLRIAPGRSNISPLVVWSNIRSTDLRRIVEEVLFVDATHATDGVARLGGHCGSE